MVKKSLKRSASDTVDAYPVKSFFVEMLTRDIDLIDAVLDLLDNCVDGIVRQQNGDSDKPYEGYWANITFDEDHFRIEDNCGGIPKSLSEYAFRMGRVREDAARDKGKKTVGTYGIGMKRALFKIGRESSVYTQCKNDRYSVRISSDWLTDEDNWKLPRSEVDKAIEEDGTVIEISRLYDNISNAFRNKQGFESDFVAAVKRHYALIMEKGFEVTINDQKIEPKQIMLLFEKFEDPTNKAATIRPFIYKTTIDDVDVLLAVGFRQPPPTEKELEDDRQAKSLQSKDAGITVVCNDRVVLSCDKTILTGWGEAGVPNYHTQFIAISGFVEFKSNNARSLPMTTTKRGIDLNSEVYLKVKNKIREGIKRFTVYTNKWKGRETESRKKLSAATLVNAKEIESVIEALPMRKVGKSDGFQYAKTLPEPKILSDKVRISFSKTKSEVKKLSEYLFEGERVKPSEVGEKCFDLLLKEAE